MIKAITKAEKGRWYDKSDNKKCTIRAIRTSTQWRGSCRQWWRISGQYSGESGTGTDISNDNETEDEEDDDNIDNAIADIPVLSETILIRRMPCMAHIIQLVIKLVYKDICSNVIMKARKLTGHIRRSSVVERLLALCGNNVIAGCTTRWNSTAHRLLRTCSQRQHRRPTLNRSFLCVVCSLEGAGIEYQQT